MPVQFMAASLAVLPPQPSCLYCPALSLSHHALCLLLAAAILLLALLRRGGRAVTVLALATNLPGKGA